MQAIQAIRENGSNRSSAPFMALTALGVVFGDIGTSPLYTMRVAFTEQALPLTEPAVLGVLSLIFWSLILVVTVKYVLLMMNADNRGEGGILAISSLLHRRVTERMRRVVILLSIIGAALFYGDGMITPAISVLSAVEGLHVATPVFQPFVVPLTLIVLSGLFMLQRRGTAKVGVLFGPIILIWFLTLGALGLAQVVKGPWILWALNPAYAVAFFVDHRWTGFVALGAVVLAITGAEALYADMGHFGRKPIRLAWFCIVLPALLLNYFGQGVLLLREPQAIANPFYLLAPSELLYPLVLLATMATVIASQAVISGAFSLTRQAVQIGYLPRLTILHTSDETIGQIYVPAVNMILFIGVLLLVIGFRRSENLAAAYGIAVIGAMAIDTAMLTAVARRVWNWPAAATIILFLFFFVIDITYLSANTLKIIQGGFVPLLLASGVFILMTTWLRGRQALFHRLSAEGLSMSSFLTRLPSSATRVKGTAVFMTGTPDSVPHALLHNLKHNKVLHERIVLMTVRTEDEPWVAPKDQLEVEKLKDGFYRIILRYGFKQEPNIPEALFRCGERGLSFNMMDTSFFLSREKVVPAINPGLPRWRERIFAALGVLALNATEFFKIPPNRVVELGTQIEI
jgi:KUP system potassium uptake protein